MSPREMAWGQPHPTFDYRSPPVDCLADEYPAYHRMTRAKPGPQHLQPVGHLLGQTRERRISGRLARDAFVHRMRGGTLREAAIETILAEGSPGMVAEQRYRVHRGPKPSISSI